jgi:hypothetical protein
MRNIISMRQIRPQGRRDSPTGRARALAAARRRFYL